ncbi:MAG: hypothetical protein ACLQIB_38790 [Isosphaeraceae bacterium]
MRTARTMWIGIGLAILLGTGAVALSRAQQAGQKHVAAPMAKGELRERVLKLRTEVDVLQLEHDAARATLVDWLRDEGKAELMG